MKAMVTGAAGFLGSHLVNSLLENGWEVVGIDNLFRGKKENIEKRPGMEFFEIDICDDKGQLSEIIGKFRPKVIFHYGAINGTEYYYDAPWKVLENNTKSTIALIDAISNSGHVPKKFLYASSSEVYGEFPDKIPTDENAISRLDIHSVRDSYASSKSIGDFLVKLFCESKGVKWTILRIFNAYGPKMDSSKFGQVVPEFIIRALSDEEFTIIGDGAQTRSFCYVGDHVRMVSKIASVENSQGVFNIGNQKEISMLELAETIHRLVGKEFSPRHLPPRENDPPRRVPDCEKAYSICGPCEFSLEEGLSETIEWYKMKSSKQDIAGADE